MIRRVEEYVEELRAELGITGLPTRRDFERLLALFPRITVLPGPDTICFHSPATDEAVIYVEPGLKGRAYEEAVLEEVAHALFTLGMASVVRRIDPNDPKIQRLAATCEMKDEAVTRSFLYAWYLPRSVALYFYYYPYELQRRSGCPEHWIRERRGQLWATVAGLDNSEPVRIWGPG